MQASSISRFSYPHNLLENESRIEFYTTWSLSAKEMPQLQDTEDYPLQSITLT